MVGRIASGNLSFGFWYLGMMPQVGLKRSDMLLIPPSSAYGMDALPRYVEAAG